LGVKIIHDVKKKEVVSYSTAECDNMQTRKSTRPVSRDSQLNPSVNHNRRGAITSKVSYCNFEAMAQ
jgi:hypothetical protein